MTIKISVTKSHCLNDAKAKTLYIGSTQMQVSFKVIAHIIQIGGTHTHTYFHLESEATNRPKGFFFF